VGHILEAVMTRYARACARTDGLRVAISEGLNF
jgi:hypothetical protein